MVLQLVANHFVSSYVCVMLFLQLVSSRQVHNTQAPEITTRWQNVPVWKHYFTRYPTFPLSQRGQENVVFHGNGVAFQTVALTPQHTVLPSKMPSWTEIQKFVSSSDLVSTVPSSDGVDNNGAGHTDGRRTSKSKQLPGPIASFFSTISSVTLATDTTLPERGSIGHIVGNVRASGDQADGLKTLATPNSVRLDVETTTRMADSHEVQGYFTEEEFGTEKRKGVRSNFLDGGTETTFPAVDEKATTTISLSFDASEMVSVEPLEQSWQLDNVTGSLYLLERSESETNTSEVLHVDFTQFERGVLNGGMIHLNESLTDLKAGMNNLKNAIQFKANDSDSSAKFPLVDAISKRLQHDTSLQGESVMNFNESGRVKVLETFEPDDDSFDHKVSSDKSGRRSQSRSHPNGNSNVTSSMLGEDCLYDIYGSSGKVDFPGIEHFENFPALEFLTCRWRVRVPSGPNIKVSFEKMALALGLEQLEISADSDGALRNITFTGTKIPNDVTVAGTRLWMTVGIRMDYVPTKVVLRFQETSQDATFPKANSITCGTTLTDLSGNISSPGYPIANYSDFQECIWHIVAPSQSVVRIVVGDFSTDVYDHVTVGIGLHAGAKQTKVLTLFGRLEHPQETLVPASSLWVQFLADDSDTDRGFFISYEVVLKDICNGTNILTNAEGHVTSLRYPEQYPINSDCTWYIHGGPDAAFVNLTFLDLSLQDGRDFVIIGEGTQCDAPGMDVSGGLMMTFTGNETDSEVVQINSSNVWIHFTSDHTLGQLPDRGFSVLYTVTHNRPPGDVTTTTLFSVSDMITEPERVFEDDPAVQVFEIWLKGILAQEVEENKELFQERLAEIINKNCPVQEDIACPLFRGEDVRLVASGDRGGQLLVRVSLSTDVPLSGAVMADTDYEDLERLFHSDLQSLDLQKESSNQGSSNLPEWLIGVIVVVILLIVAFFAMVIYSLLKERKKSRAGSYGGTTSTGSMCEEVEVGKSDGNIRITAFSIENGKDLDTINGTDGANGSTWALDAEAVATLQRPQNGISGCMNPAFIDDEASKDDDEKKGDKSQKSKDSKKHKDNKRAQSPAKSQKNAGKGQKNQAKNPPKAQNSKKAKEGEACGKNDDENATNDAVDDDSNQQINTAAIDLKQTAVAAAVVDVVEVVDRPQDVHESLGEKHDLGTTKESTSSSSDDVTGHVEVVIENGARPEDEGSAHMNNEDFATPIHTDSVDFSSTVHMNNADFSSTVHENNNDISGNKKEPRESSTDELDNHSNMSTNL